MFRKLRDALKTVITDVANIKRLLDITCKDRTFISMLYSENTNYVKSSVLDTQTAKVDLILEHLNLRYQKECEEKIPKLVKIKNRKKK